MLNVFVVILAALENAFRRLFADSRTLLLHRIAAHKRAASMHWNLVRGSSSSVNRHFDAR